MTKFLWNEKKAAHLSLVQAGQEGSDLFDFASAHSAFAGKAGEVYVLAAPGKDTALLAGLGKAEELTDKAKEKEALRLAFYKAAKKASEVKEEAVYTDLSAMPELKLSLEERLEAALTGIIEADYKFSKKTQDEEEDEKKETSWSFGGLEEKAFQQVKERTEGLMEGLFLARDLNNETSNHMYPETLAARVKEALEPLGVDVEVFEREKIEELGMEAYLSVAKGSDKDPRFIIMRWQGAGKDEPATALVGKGLTYDSGGYCLKSPKGMATMHCDMGGAGTVIGTIYALAKNKVKANVTGVVAACENLLSGHSYKTGDIISSLSGKTIEVLNTDAEGRLTLADALYYTTSVLKPARVIDLATLTGAAVAALSEEYTAAITNDEDFFEEFRKAAREAGEKVWLLPNDENLAKRNRETKVADLQNTTTGGAGTITAGQFVGEFLAEDIPWIHLDIAGTAYRSKAQDYWPERATGYHVRGLYGLLAE